jgi:hypothetical protein
MPPGNRHQFPPVAILIALTMTIGVRAQVDQTRGGLPPIGIAVEEANGAWCVEFPSDTQPSLAPGTPVAIVFPDRGESMVWTSRLTRTSRGQCQTAFPQTRWHGYSAYHVELLSSSASSVASHKTVGLAVASELSWKRSPQGTLYADLDGNGLPEEARRCAADEGEHFTIWSLRPDGEWERTGHEYFDWGAITDRTCGPGEDGTDPLPETAAAPLGLQ